MMKQSKLQLARRCPSGCPRWRQYREQAAFAASTGAFDAAGSPPDVFWYDSIAGSSRAAEEHASRVQLPRLILVEGSRHDFIRERLVSTVWL